MEYLRWILLAAGLFFVLIIYLIGSNRRRKDARSDFDLDDEIPEFSAKDWDELDEGVGKVRIVARETVEGDTVELEDYSDLDNADETSRDDQFDEVIEEPIESHTQQPPEQQPEKQPEQRDSSADIIVLYILARSSEQLTGDKINSAAQANGLVFGKMNIFHRLDGDGESVFSLANMIEPGNFDADAMHDLQTPGIIVFMQASAVANPGSVFDDMLQCAYHISEMLDAELCNRKRQPLTQSDAEQYRELVAGANA